MSTKQAGEPQHQPGVASVIALEGSALVFNLLLSLEDSVRSVLLAEELLRLERWEEKLMAV